MGISKALGADRRLHRTRPWRPAQKYLVAASFLARGPIKKISPFPRRSRARQPVSSVQLLAEENAPQLEGQMVHAKGQAMIPAYSKFPASPGSLKAGSQPSSRRLSKGRQLRRLYGQSGSSRCDQAHQQSADAGPGPRLRPRDPIGAILLAST